MESVWRMARTLHILLFLLARLRPHNPLVEGSSPSGPTNHFVTELLNPIFHYRFINSALYEPKICLLNRLSHLFWLHAGTQSPCFPLRRYFSVLRMN